jgi:sigma54-dependent transcription regulator
LRAAAFREDLYYRLNVVSVQILPLRERREDIAPLLDHFLRKFVEKNRREVTGLTAAANRDSFCLGGLGMQPGAGRPGTRTKLCLTAGAHRAMK